MKRRWSARTAIFDGRWIKIVDVEGTRHCHILTEARGTTKKLLHRRQSHTSRKRIDEDLIEHSIIRIFNVRSDVIQLLATIRASATQI